MKQEPQLNFSDVGEVLLEQGDAAATLHSFLQAQKQAEDLAVAEPTNEARRVALATCIGQVASAHHRLGKLTEAGRNYQRARMLVCQQDPIDPGRHHLRPGHDTFYAAMTIQLRIVSHCQGDLLEALDNFEEAGRILHVVTTREPNNPEWRRLVGIVAYRSGNVYVRQGDLDQALALHERGRRQFAVLAATDQTNPKWQNDLAFSLEAIGAIYRERGDTASAIARYEQARLVRCSLGTANPRDSRMQRAFAECLNASADVLRDHGDLQSALSCYKHAENVYKELASTHSSPSFELVRVLTNIAELHQRLDDRKNQALALQEATLIAQQGVAAFPDDARWASMLWAIHVGVARHHERDGNVELSLESYERARQIAKKKSRGKARRPARLGPKACRQFHPYRPGQE